MNHERTASKLGSSADDSEVGAASGSNVFGTSPVRPLKKYNRATSKLTLRAWDYFCAGKKENTQTSNRFASYTIACVLLSTLSTQVASNLGYPIIALLASF
ncbi:MAG: hypothetical protein COA78_13755 [Blastopirellula sp.]|nr:MAG: hypothetical protein COA78_13755 [Blastopirellula sp.]